MSGRGNPYVNLAGVWLGALGELVDGSVKIIDGVIKYAVTEHRDPDRCNTYARPAIYKARGKAQSSKAERIGKRPTCFNCGTKFVLSDPSRSLNKFICPNCKRVLYRRHRR